MRTYYHGRSKSRPYYGNHLFLTTSLEYASRYSDDSSIFECSIAFSEDKIFSIKNSKNQELIRKTFGEETLLKIETDSEIDWSALSYLSNDKFDTSEDFFRAEGFLGVFLKEREGIESLYVFDQENVLLERKIKV